MTAPSFSVIDPYVSTGYLSLASGWNVNSANVACPSGSYGCSGSTSLNCGCAYLSCVLSGTQNLCWCASGEVATTTTCTCSTGFYLVNGGCCETSCATCVSGSLLCLTCIASNTYLDTTEGCDCNPGYYGTKPLTTSGACSACYSACATCNQANICLTCIASNSSPDSTKDAIAILDTMELSHWQAVVLAQRAIVPVQLFSPNICLTCIALNSSPDSTQGCDCNSRYYGSKPLTSSSSCSICYSECSTCSQSSICLTCISSNASPDASVGCNCNSGYSGTKPLLLVIHAFL